MKYTIRILGALAGIALLYAITVEAEKPVNVVTVESLLFGVETVEVIGEVSKGDTLQVSTGRPVFMRSFGTGNIGQKYDHKAMIRQSGHMAIVKDIVLTY